MPISTNWMTGEIYVPKDYLTLIDIGPPEFRELDVNVFRLDLTALHDDPDGRIHPHPYVHDTETTLSGIVYARKLQIVSPYFVTFEPGGYAVLLVGANNNILDVSTVNGVSIRPNNSAGLQILVLQAPPVGAPYTVISVE